MRVEVPNRVITVACLEQCYVSSPQLNGELIGCEIVKNVW